MGSKRRYDLSVLLTVGLVFHLVFIGSVFDCYFTSPVVQGMQPYASSSPEVKRLVLIVGDGLRADLLFNLNPFPHVQDAPEVVAPYLRSIAESRGAFGVSHTRVPTESRPGHVALIGGMYEDVSAVTKGWKTNPVDFDSVFNRSSHTFSFGSPDILPMFAKGASPGRVKTWMYKEEDEDFTKDATGLDVWVLDQLKELFKNASADASLNAQLREDKTVFFLHLLGLDTTGHSFKPHSQEYMSNIRVVDDIVRETETLVRDFFKDDATSFVFSADHGMANRGNHGDGDPDNTRTPLITWGAGVRGPLPDSSPSSHDDYSAPWGLTHRLRRDVEQADVAALMSALLGVEWPVNGVGVLPDVDPDRVGYLQMKEGEKGVAEAALVNAKVLVEHYRVKHELKRAHTLFYRPFAALEHVTHGNMTERELRLLNIEMSIEREDWTDARSQSKDLIELALQGLRYLWTYDRLLIRLIVIAAYTGWAAYASLYIFRPAGSRASIGVDLAAAAVLLGSWCVFAVQRNPWTYYLYAAFPTFFWHQAIKFGWPALRTRFATTPSASAVVTPALRGLAVLALLQGMVAAYTERSIWSIALVLIGVCWPLLSWPKGLLARNWPLFVGWVASCLSMAVFPLLPVDKEESLGMIMVGAALMLSTGLGVLCVVRRRERLHQSPLSSQTYFLAQLGLIVAAAIVTRSSVLSLQAKAGLPLINQIAGWIIFLAASALPFWRIKHFSPLSQMLSLFLAFAPTFVILSISVEGLFYVSYCATLYFWIEVEAMVRTSGSVEGHAQNGKQVQNGEQVQGGKEYEFQSGDLRIALFFLLFVQVAFFGTGNVASISSFYLQPVYRLVPIFSPFLMAALLIFKVVAPYVMLSAAFATLNARLHLPPFSLFLVALTLTDGMTIAFFFNVTDTGSWLEIGQSISFFCITSLLLVWSAGICAGGEALMAGSLRMPDKGTIKME